MSVRRTDVQQAAETASRFSLRGVVTAETLGFQAPNQVAPQKGAQTQQFQSYAALKFTLPQQKPQPQPPQQPQLRASIGAQRAASAVAPSTSSVFRLSAPGRGNGRISPSSGGGGGFGFGMATKSGPVDSAEVLRLTVYVDDLTQRLRETGTKLQHAEVNLARTNQALIAERHAATTKITQMRQDLSASHDIEGKLRTELQSQADKQMQQATSQNDFMVNVRSALATQQISDKQQTEVLALENRVAALNDDKHRVEAVIADLGIERKGAELKLVEVQQQLTSYVDKAKKLGRNIEEQEMRLTALEQVPNPEHVAAAVPAVAAVAEPVEPPDLMAMDLPTDLGKAPMAPTGCCDAAYDDMDDSFVLHSEPPQVGSPAETFAPPAPPPRRDSAESHHLELTIFGNAPSDIVSAGLGARVHARRPMPNMYVSDHFEMDCPMCVSSYTAQDAAEPISEAPHSEMQGLIMAIVSDVKDMLDNSKKEISELEALFDMTPQIAGLVMA
ncbi:MAG: hypothetical protein ACKVI4_15100 [Actinomycetales bacterium]